LQGGGLLRDVGFGDDPAGEAGGAQGIEDGREVKTALAQGSDD